ncbi:MAG: hypothetical protein ACREA9_24340 [Pyrinomonadaceae bacterium]|jgi:hypothetical protein
MPNFLVEQRERWDMIVIYDIEADSEDQAKELTQTGTCKYTEHEVINRDCEKVINVRETRVH